MDEYQNNVMSSDAASENEDPSQQTSEVIQKNMNEWTRKIDALLNRDMTVNVEPAPKKTK